MTEYIDKNINELSEEEFKALQSRYPPGKTLDDTDLLKMYGFVYNKKRDGKNPSKEAKLVRRLIHEIDKYRTSFRKIDELMERGHEGYRETHNPKEHFSLFMEKLYSNYINLVHRLRIKNP